MSYLRAVNYRVGTNANGNMAEQDRNEESSGAPTKPAPCPRESGILCEGEGEDFEQTQEAPAYVQEHFGQLVGRSDAMRRLFARLARIAPMEASVLIHGETGTGKELVARAIHDASPRANGPFVVIDCGALLESLPDAELFGHAKGADTGAVSARAGAIESAHTGTVFLDEIGELPVTMQPKLLRVLESRTVRRVGETKYRDVDVRFVSATHRDLSAMVRAREFR